MCGRFVLDAPDDLPLRFRLEQMAFHFGPTFNAAPSQSLPVIIETEPEVWEAKLMHWGLVPRWKSSGKPMPPPINARSETLAEKAMFKKLLEMRRCLVPATGFYEWRAGAKGERKQPYFIHPTDQRLFAFAGLWDDTRPEGATDDIEGSFTIVTTAANSMMSQLHHRMPVILEPGDEPTWLSTDLHEPEAVTPLLDAYPGDAMEAFPVSLAVNNVRNNDPHLIEREDQATEPIQGALFS